MTNEYYNADSLVARRTLARAVQVNTALQAIAAGFDKLPDPALVNEARTTYGTVGGTANAITLALANPITAYAAGLRVSGLIAASNTGPVTLNVDGLGARTVQRLDGAPLAVSALSPGSVHEFVYNGSAFAVLSPNPWAGIEAVVPPLSPQAFGAVGDGVTDDSAALTAAHGHGVPINYGSASYNGDEAGGYLNLYGSTKYKSASQSRLQYGRLASPVDDPEPINATVKFSSADRDVDSSAWDQVGYYGLVKVSGDAFGAAMTGSARGEGGSGDIVGVHGRAQSDDDGVGELFGMWSYVNFTGTSGQPVEMVGHEINLRHSGDDWPMPALDFGATKARGLTIVTADGGKRGQIGLDIGAQAGTGGWLWGVRIRQNGIVSSDTAGGDTRAILIEGASTIGGRYGGLSFAGAGHLDYGIDFSGLTQDIGNDAAITLRAGDRIRFNGDKTSGLYIAQPEGVNAINFAGLAIQISGTQVVGAQQSAIANDASGAGNQATVNAILAAMRAHGLIAT